MRNLSDFLQVKEAAELLGVAPNTVRNWERDGKIPSFRNPINGYRLFKQKDLEKLLRKINRQSSSR